MIHTNLHGIKYLIDGDLNDPEVKKLMHSARLHYENLAIGHGIAEVDDFRLERPGFKIRSVFGEVTIHIQVPPVGREVVEGARVVTKEEEEVSALTYCLLVEMVSDRYTVEYRPEGFAIFVPTGGHRSIQEEGGLSESLTTPGMRYFGYTTQMVENEPEKHDPLGIIGQPTERLAWCKHEEPGLLVEQVKRVDQGWGAYDGDSSTTPDEEVTEINSQYIWSYEDIEWSYQWFSVDPGPPPYSLCGYTWAWPESYGPGGDDTADADDRKHLFYYGPGVNDINFWWPPNFTQLIVIESKYNENEVITRYKDAYLDEWDLFDSIGACASVGEWIFPNGLGKWIYKSDETERLWGIVWGTIYSGLDDFVVEPTDPPHLDYEYRDPMEWDEILTTYGRAWADYLGVYVKERWEEMFITGEYLWPQDVSYHTEQMIVWKRPEVSTDRFRDPGDLNEMQLEILEGNIDKFPYDWGFEDDDGRYIDGTILRDPAWFGINVGGAEYAIERQEVFGSYYRNNFTSERKTDAQFRDYGIFTKEGTGIKTDEIIPQGEDEAREIQVVDPETIQPIYTYSAVIGYGIFSTHGIPDKMIYGMVLDDKHYRTDAFTRLNQADSYRYHYYVPELENAKNANGEQMFCTREARVGIIKTTHRHLREIVEDEPETTHVIRN